METQSHVFDLIEEDLIYYRVGQDPQIIDLDTYCYLTINGRGNPEHRQFQQAIRRIYALAGIIRQYAQKASQDFELPPMECTWWIDGGLAQQHRFMQIDPSCWNWKIQLRMPDFIEKQDFDQAKQTLLSSNQLDDGVAPKWERVNQGRCIQILHLGSWDAEAPSIHKIMAVVQKESLIISGYHKEIYLSEPEMVPEDEKKTILRYQRENQ